MHCLIVSSKLKRTAWPLSAADYELLLGPILMFANLQERLEGNDLSIHKLRKLLGIVRSFEKLRNLLPATNNETTQDSDADTKTGKSASGKGAQGRKTSK